MPKQKEPNHKIPPAELPNRSATEREFNDLLYPSVKQHSDLAQNVAVLEERISHLATHEDLQRVKFWTITTIVSTGIALISAAGSIYIFIRAVCKTYLPILKDAPRVLYGNISAETLRFCKSLIKDML